MRYAAAVAMLLPGVLSAQDISGDWQGTLKVGKAEVRVVISVAKAAGGGWMATELTPDDGSNGAVASSVIFEGSTLKLTFDVMRATYEGTFSESKNSLEGTWTQGSGLPLNLERATVESSWRRDGTPHTIQFITVDDNVRLEVVDWGGSGRALIMLAGGNNHAHAFDKFAPKLTGSYHVYGITRRGSGASSVPPPTRANYAADRLGDDILAVIAALKLDRPILVRHSLAGEELSSVGSRHPEKVAGLIYLDAGYAYAYDPSPSGPPSPPPQREITTVQEAMRAGMQKYTRIDVPILAIYALPHERGITDPAKRAEADARDLAFQGAMAKAFEKGLPSARVIWLPHAGHFVFRSNEADVLREMNTFIAGLPLKSAAVRRN
jgi:pimeloyl-ACP methyl ester carboxylesterase